MSAVTFVEQVRTLMLGRVTELPRGSLLEGGRTVPNSDPSDSRAPSGDDHVTLCCLESLDCSG